MRLVFNSIPVSIGPRLILRKPPTHPFKPARRVSDLPRPSDSSMVNRVPGSKPPYTYFHIGARNVSLPRDRLLPLATSNQHLFRIGVEEGGFGIV